MACAGATLHYIQIFSETGKRHSRAEICFGHDSYCWSLQALGSLGSQLRSQQFLFQSLSSQFPVCIRVQVPRSSMKWQIFFPLLSIQVSFLPLKIYKVVVEYCSISPVRKLCPGKFYQWIAMGALRQHPSCALWGQAPYVRSDSRIASNSQDCRTNNNSSCFLHPEVLGEGCEWRAEIHTHVSIS